MVRLDFPPQKLGCQVYTIPPPAPRSSLVQDPSPFRMEENYRIRRSGRLVSPGLEVSWVSRISIPRVIPATAIERSPIDFAQRSLVYLGSSSGDSSPIEGFQSVPFVFTNPFTAVIYPAFVRHVYGMVQIDSCMFSVSRLIRPDGYQGACTVETLRTTRCNCARSSLDQTLLFARCL